jgi:hypothetical protein
MSRMNQALFDRAMVAIKDCLGVEPGQEALIVEDGTLSPRLTDAFVHCAKALGANVVTLGYQPRHFISMREFGLFGAPRWADTMSVCRSPS